MRPTARTIALALFLLLFEPSRAAADSVTIDASTIVGFFHVGEFAGGVGIAGQTFTVPAGVDTLTRFEFWIDDSSRFPVPSAGTAFDFRGYVASWTETDPTAGAGQSGDLLYQSVISRTSEAIGFERFAFDLALDVTPGHTLVAFLAPVSLSSEAPMPDFWSMATSFSDQSGEGSGEGRGTDYPGGHFLLGWWRRDQGIGWFQGDEFSNQRWDAAFRLSFTADALDPIPEPGTLLLVGTGVAAIWRTAYRRNKCSSR